MWNAPRFLLRQKDLIAFKKVPWQYIIVDEGHRIKNAECKLVQNLNLLTSRHRILLTGTPLQNNLNELWALLNFCLPNIFDSADSFEEWFNSPFGNTMERVDLKEEMQLLIINRLHQVLRPFLLRREKSEVLDQLPEKVEVILRCELSALQRQLYKQIQEKGRILISDALTGARVKNLNNPMMQLRKICNHPLLHLEDEDDTVISNMEDVIRSSGKFELLDRMLYKLFRSGHRVLLFSQMTQVLDLLEDYCNYREYKHTRLDGNTKNEIRGERVAEFNRPDSDIFIFLLSTRAGGLGLNLQTADTVILFDSDWNPQQDLQAQARAHRIGQQKSVRVFTFVTNTLFEERVLQRAQEKRQAEAKVIRAGKFNTKSTENERKEFLRMVFHESAVELDSDILDNTELNEMLARSEEEFQQYECMDQEIKAMRLRIWRSLGRKGHPPRLMTDEELPEWIRHSETHFEAQNVPLEVLQAAQGRGKRQRGEAIYSDLSDAQWEKVFASNDPNATMKELMERNKRNVGDARAKQHHGIQQIDLSEEDGRDKQDVSTKRLHTSSPDEDLSREHGGGRRSQGKASSPRPPSPPAFPQAPTSSIRRPVRVVSRSSGRLDEFSSQEDISDEDGVVSPARARQLFDTDEEDELED